MALYRQEKLPQSIRDIAWKAAPIDNALVPPPSA